MQDSSGSKCLFARKGMPNAVPQQGGTLLELNHLAEKAGVALFHMVIFGSGHIPSSKDTSTQMFSPAVAPKL